MANLFELLRFLDIAPMKILSLTAHSGPGPLELTANSFNMLQMTMGVLITLTALGCGLLAIQFLLRFLGRRLLTFFGLYCMVAGSFFWLYFSLS